ncbi:SDR family NAD(P)-dependent oxidoreductase [Micromonospora sp. CA-263727]|uniref:SDR family NAD(P)-dependent oxidoreductase n=1 Tax=Micromonospora sp. CA-263727 TaxID=3239967 RepID=UPI003D8EE06A
MFVVTGGNAGIGYFISEQLASAGATVVLASRSQSKADLAMKAIAARIPKADLRYHSLDISDLSAARQSGAALAEFGRIDGIVLNAAVLSQKQRRETADGHELVFGTNYYGNVQFAAAALPTLLHTEGARLVTMGSVAQRIGRLDLNDLEQRNTTYRSMRTYGTSKQAQMHFGLELNRRLVAAGQNMMSLLAHPGGALDGLTPDRPPAFEQTRRDRRNAVLMRPFVQGKDRAAWPAVRALLDPTAAGGELWAPGSATGRCPPRRDPLRGALTDQQLARDLWQKTQETLDIQWTV